MLEYMSTTERSVFIMRKVRTFSNDKELVVRRRNHIVKIATKLIVKKGYNRINTRELAAALGMSTGGLYHYIGSKEDILHLIINFASELPDQTLSTLNKKLKHVAPTKSLIESVKVYIETVENNRDFLNFINHIMLSLTPGDRKIVYEAESRVVEYFENLLLEGIEKGEFVALDTRLIANNVVAIANAWANRGWYLKRYYTLEQYSSEQIETLISQISKCQANS
jgi:AcrR family transcriptional regulator